MRLAALHPLGLAGGEQGRPREWGKGYGVPGAAKNTGDGAERRAPYFANSPRSASIMKSRRIGTASRVIDNNIWNTMCEPCRNSSSTAAR